jgi:short-subunit dehydrogenase
VIAAARRRERLDALADELPVGSVSPLVLDVTRAESIAEARSAVDMLTGGHGLDVLVNCAGVGAYSPLELIDLADARVLFDTNVLGVLAMTQAFLPRMRERRRGRIVNVSSIGGRIAVPLLGAYNATKFALEAMSDALRNEVKPFGIEVCVVEPGPVRSAFAASAIGPRALAADSPYGVTLRHAARARERFQARATAPEGVARVIARAAVGRKTRARYVVPWMMVLAFFVLQFIPTRWIDRIKRRALVA